MKRNNLIIDTMCQHPEKTLFFLKDLDFKDDYSH